MSPSDPLGKSHSSADAQEWHRIAEERRRQIEQLADRRIVKIALPLLSWVRRSRWTLDRAMGGLRAESLRWVRSLLGIVARSRAQARLRRLRDALAALTPAERGGSSAPELVTAVIVTAAQPGRLSALLAALERIGVSSIVVDNAGGSETGEVIARFRSAQHLRLDEPVNYAAANEAGIALVATEWVLLLNDDVLPLEDSWLERLLACADGGTVAVGAQLVHGRRSWSGGAAVDATVQHAGIGLRLDGSLVRPVHLDRGSPPRPRPGHRDVAAATGACLLVRTAAHREVGGFHLGFDYGMEDVDLCLRLREHGRIRVALDAVLLHEEGATRLSGGHAERVARAARQDENRSLLDARHAPRLRRELVRRALAGERARDGAEMDGAPSVALHVHGPMSSTLEAAFEGSHVVICRTARARRAAPRPAGVIVTDGRALPRAARAANDAPVILWLSGTLLDDLRLRRSDEQLVGAGAVDRVVLELDPASEEGVLTAARSTLDVMLGTPRPMVQEVETADTDTARHVLADVLLAPRWSVRIGAPEGRRGRAWGDTQVAEALRQELRTHGAVPRIATRGYWGGPRDRSADVTLHLKGRGVAPQAPSQVNIVWVLSHPSEVAPGELEAADVVVAASARLAEHLEARLGRSVPVLPQATDARRFGPGAPVARRVSQTLFIGNTRSAQRPVILAALATGLPITLIGSGWERYVDPRLVAARSVAAKELPDWYRSADVVLNDHWGDMRRWGIVSNRVFDALACGAAVLSDSVPGLAELLDGAVVEIDEASAVGPALVALLDDPARRQELVSRGQRTVLSLHTWEHRAAALHVVASEALRRLA